MKSTLCPLHRLSVEQVDTLWTCLAHDPRHSDDLFSWMLSQVRGKEQHALGMDSLRYAASDTLLSNFPAALFQSVVNGAAKLVFPFY